MFNLGGLVAPTTSAGGPAGTNLVRAPTAGRAPGAVPGGAGASGPGQSMGSLAGPQQPPTPDMAPHVAQSLAVLAHEKRPIGDVIKDPSMHGHVATVLSHVEGDPQMQARLQAMGIGPDKIAAARQMLTGEMGKKAKT